jgi:hypothetical protein
MRGELPVVTGCFGLAVGHFLLVQNLAHSAISALRFSKKVGARIGRLGLVAFIMGKRKLTNLSRVVGAFG